MELEYKLNLGLQRIKFNNILNHFILLNSFERTKEPFRSTSLHLMYFHIIQVPFAKFISAYNLISCKIKLKINKHFCFICHFFFEIIYFKTQLWYLNNLYVKNQSNTYKKKSRINNQYEFNYLKN